MTSYLAPPAHQSRDNERQRQPLGSLAARPSRANPMDANAVHGLHEISSRRHAHARRHHQGLVPAQVQPPSHGMRMSFDAAPYRQVVKREHKYARASHYGASQLRPTSRSRTASNDATGQRLRSTGRLRWSRSFGSFEGFVKLYSGCETTPSSSVRYLSIDDDEALWSCENDSTRVPGDAEKRPRGNPATRVPEVVGRSVDEVDAVTLPAPRRRPRPACAPRAPSADVRRCRTSSRSRSPARPRTHRPTRADTPLRTSATATAAR